MPRPKKTDQYISLVKELFAKKNNKTLSRTQENEYQVKLGKIWASFSQGQKKEVTAWIEDNLVIEKEQEKKEGIKHLIECNCSLPQFRNRPERVFHKFLVFSIIDENNRVIPKYVQCNNCGSIHKVVEIGKSEFTGRDESHALLTIEDIKLSIPSDIRDILDDYRLELPYWEEVAFIYENQRWGSTVILSSEEEEPGVKVTKTIKFIGPGSAKIETSTDQTIIS